MGISPPELRTGKTQMNEIDMVWRGLITGLIIAAPVGPVNVLCIRQTLAKGWRSGLLSGLGAAAVDTLYGAIAAFSITVIIRTLVQEQFRIRLFGGVLLLIIGIAYFFKRPVMLAHPENCAVVCSGFVPAFLLNLMNPTAVLSFMAVLTALGLGSPMQWWSTLLVVCGIFCGSMGWWIVLSTLVNRLRGRFTPRIVIYMNRVAGLAIGGFGIALMVISCARM
jgi:threonine/homoserine/homoserine lactone efflux protein